MQEIGGLSEQNLGGTPRQLFSVDVKRDQEDDEGKDNEDLDWGETKSPLRSTNTILPLLASS